MEHVSQRDPSDGGGGMKRGGQRMEAGRDALYMFENMIGNI
jgi:hypothetical protein